MIEPSPFIPGRLYRTIPVSDMEKPEVVMYIGEYVKPYPEGGPAFEWVGLPVALVVNSQGVIHKLFYFVLDRTPL